MKFDLLLATSCLLGSTLGAHTFERDYKNMFPELTKGNSDVSRIVAGEDAPEGRYPYMANMLDEESDIPFCGGSLIAPNVVLTAGHCSGIARVSISCLDYSPVFGGDCEVISVSEEYLNPGYYHLPVPSPDFDILILAADSINLPIAYLAAPSLELPTGLGFKAMGLGITRYNPFFAGNRPASLQHTDMVYIPNEQCSIMYDGINFGYAILETMLCAGGDNTGVCNGDSGSPLVVPCEATGADLQVGVVSWGAGCGGVQYPGAFGRVSTAIDFIETHMEAQGHNLTLITDMDDFCLVGGTQAPTPPVAAPTSFPSLPTNWTCYGGQYGALDGCQCGCGAPDPDCYADTYPPQGITFCSSIENCVEGVCID